MRKLFFKGSRELQIDDEPDSPTAETSGSDFQREESHDDPNGSRFSVGTC
jgi:hypothetical protein